MNTSSLRRSSTGSSTSGSFNASWARHSWDPHSLPSTPSLDGRPVWEPSILNLSQVDNESDTKRREAVLEYTGGDLPRTVQILDTFTELELLDDNLNWAKEAHRVAHVEDEMESARFFETLRHELHQDFREVQMEDVEDLKHQQMEVDISQWLDLDVRASVNRPIILRWNYEFKINPDGTWLLLDPWDATVPPCSPVEGVKNERRDGKRAYIIHSKLRRMWRRKRAAAEG